VSRILVVGAGFSGAVLARALAEAGLNLLVVEERDHVAGNCHTAEDAATGIMVHRYGPHIFHTDDDEIWRFVQRFGEWVRYRHSVFATVRGKVFSLPVNLLTINQFYGTAMGPEEAKAFIAARCIATPSPANFHEQALALVGRELYEAFFHHYTVKQWGVEAAELPASIFRRLPLRFTYDSNYFHHQRQAMPREGYTAIIANMLAHPAIELRLSLAGEDLAEGFAHTFYTGGIDRYFGYRLGRLGYRTLRFEEIRGHGDMLGCPVMNFPDAEVAWTRMTEHRHLSPWRKINSNVTIVWKEFPEAASADSVPYYPLRLAGDERLLRNYVELARREQGVTFLGRLGSYAYIDMDMAVRRALDTAAAALTVLGEGKSPPVFIHEPLGKA
jgi:UDP-galactopyranose mutase